MEKTNKLLDLRTIGGIRDRPPVRQKPAQMTRVPVAEAALVDPLAPQVKLVLIQSG